jgi:hypothetical protein
MDIRGAAGALLAALTLVAATPAPAAAASHQTTIVNFDRSGNQLTRFDVEGHAVDAHDGDLALFGSRYFLYGTSYDCGYGLKVNGTPFCGFKVYSSPDLVHWTDRGPLFDASTGTWQRRCAPPTFGCYRPHVVYNARTERYVLWVNGYDNRSGYHVFTSRHPAGPFEEEAEPTLRHLGAGPGFNNGDFDLFVDADGSGYIAYTDISRRHAQVVERLDDTYTTGTGEAADVGAIRSEGPSLFRRGATYYLVYGNTCPYCAARTEYRTASGPLGPWSATTTISANSCQGQPAFVAPIPTTSGTAYLYGADLWNSRRPNQALANYFWAPLSFAADGAIRPISCVATARLTLTTGSPGEPVVAPDLDQTAGRDGFRTHCDISASWSRLQSFAPSRTGSLSGVSLTTFQSGWPDRDLVLDVVRVDGRLQPVGAPLRTITVSRDRIGWSARSITVRPGVPVLAGDRYAILARTSSGRGCYGFAFNDATPYRSGSAAYRKGAAAWTAETRRSLKFDTQLNSGAFKGRGGCGPGPCE